MISRGLSDEGVRVRRWQNLELLSRIQYGQVEISIPGNDQTVVGHWQSSLAVNVLNHGK